MEFFIGKNANLPLLKLQVVKDGRQEYQDFMNFIESSTIYFSMKDEKSGENRIQLKQGGFVSKTFDDPNTPTEYYIYYKFTKKDTKKVGRFEGQFLLKNEIGTLILPIREPLYINVTDSTIPDTEPETNIITLLATYFQSSIGVTYYASILYPIQSDVTISFTNVLGTLSGPSVVITTSITIPANQRYATVTLTLNGDYNNLNKTSLFYDISTNTEFSTRFNYLVEPNFVFEPIPSPTPSFTPTPTPTPTPIPHPIDDITYKIIPDSDYISELIPDSDFFIKNIPENQLNYLYVPNEDNNYILIDYSDFAQFIIPNNDVNNISIPNNDTNYEIINCTGITYNLVILPWQPPSNGNILFTNFSVGDIGTLNPNTFDVDGVDMSFINNYGVNKENYLSTLTSSTYYISFTQGVDTAIYSGNSDCFVFDSNNGIISSVTLYGTQPLLLIQPSNNNFILGDVVCVEITPIPNLNTGPIMWLDSRSGLTSSNSLWVDLSGFGNDATIMNGVIPEFWPTFNFFPIINLDGNFQHILPQNGFGNSLNSSLGFTYEMWVRQPKSSSPAPGTLITEWGGVPPNGWNDAQIAIVKDGVNFYLNFGVYDVGFNGNGFELIYTEWNHVVMTYDGVNTTKLYLNGVQIYEPLVGVKSYTNPTYLTFGLPDNMGIYLGGADGYFRGDISVWKVYDRCLTSGETLTNYNNNKGRFNGGFEYNNFSTTSGLNLVGNSQVSENNWIYLTNAIAATVGNVYRLDIIDYSQRSFTLEWNFECTGGSGADGFCLQWTKYNSEGGGAGGEVGCVFTIETINAILFKTYTNNNITWYHSNVEQSVQSVPAGYFRQNVYYWADFNATAFTMDISYSLDGVKPLSPQHTLTSFTFDNNLYYIGFGAACGAETDNHILKSMKLTFN